MHIVSRLHRRTYVIPAMLFLIFTGCIILPAITGKKEKEGDEIFFMAFLGLLAVMFPFLMLFKAKEILLDEQGITIRWKFRGKQVRYLHSEITGVDFKLNLPVQSQFGPQYQHVIEIIPTGEPVLFISNIGNENIEALIDGMRKVYGSRARDVIRD